MNSRQEKYLLGEYDALRRELEHKFDEMRTLIRYSLIVTGGIWTWLWTQPDISEFSFLGFLPFVFSVLFALLAEATRRQILRIAKYISSIEGKFKLPKGFGWETKLQQKRKSWIHYWEILYWLLICFGNCLGAVYWLGYVQ